ncbi:metal-dependent hydrolase [Nocardioides marmoriginsengisoli]|uniref:Metal-dependent hydrolase n=1 Tax=Nocardioides marmoriginsengisoli TaxID=661483 RepID=A0A3N0CNP7_9ACTN|nr:metal-dependent hydrolase [Nocardioides marmoriginsengisoli]RNL65078.1 metal-dependent hydrolase [Nocardioides marmoriginsengisoli]
MKTPKRQEPAKVVLQARDVSWDWSGLPLRWIPGEPFASHLINVMHLLLPEGERWFVKVFSEALPLIKDDQLREEVIGFIGQEGMHASAHQGVQDYFSAHDLDTSTYVHEIEHVFGRLLDDRGLSGRRAEEWLIERLALVAGIEHLTAFLGNWVLNSPALDAAGADARMLDLLRWHGAEEVEHRAVAYDVYMHLDGRYSRRVRTYLVAVGYLGWLWIRGVRALMKADPGLGKKDKPRWRDLFRTKRRGTTPGYWDLISMSWRYLRPGYHPSHEGSTSQAVAYLATSPAALAAEQHGEA